MITIKVFSQANTIQQFSKYFVGLGDTGQWVYYSTQASLLYFLLFLTINHSMSGELPERKQTSFTKALRSNFLFTLCLIAFVMVSRIPNIMQGPLNPDESLWICLSKTLAHDPRYWVSTDGGTGGPIVSFALLLLKFIGLPIDHGSLKIMSGLTMALSAASTFIFFRYVSGSLLARVVVLPLAVCVAIMNYSDLVAYNSEHIAVFFISMALIFLARLYSIGPGTYNSNIIWLSILLGLVPFTKLQGAPIAAVIGCWAIYILYRKKLLSKLKYLIGFAILPTLLIVIIVWSYGGLEYFWTSYIKQNLFYTSRHGTVEHPFLQKIVLLFKLLLEPKELIFYVHYSLIFSLLGLLCFFTFPKRIRKYSYPKIIFALSIFICASYCVVAPLNNFEHYIVLLFVPLTILSGLIIDVVIFAWLHHIKKFKTNFNNFLLRTVIVTIFLAATSFYYFQANFTYYPFYYHKAVNYQHEYIVYKDLTKALKEYYSPGARLTVWGWTSSLYETTDFILGTRGATSQAMIEHVPLEDFFTKYFLIDMDRNKPLLFVETIGPNYFAYTDRVVAGFENFPKVRDYVNENYRFESEVEGARIFVRKDYSFEKPIPDFEVENGNADKEYLGYFDTIEKSDGYIKFEGWTVLGENIEWLKVRLLLTKNGHTWALNTVLYPRADVVEHFNKSNWLKSGYSGKIILNTIPQGEYKMSLYVENRDKVANIDLNRTFNPADF
jgi:hypothetical protein